MAYQRLFVASDHAGFPFKNQLVSYLKAHYDVVDLGPTSEERVDYPDFADQVCKKLIEDNNQKQCGILICGSGQGMAMRANKYKEIRAALCWDKDSAHLSREHNNANVLCLGARLLPAGTLLEVADEFLKTDFAGGRHQSRVEKIGLAT